MTTVGPFIKSQRPLCNATAQTAQGSCWLWTYLEVIREQQFRRPQKAQDVAENLPIPVDEIMLLQTVQDNGLGAIEEAAYSGRDRGWVSDGRARPPALSHPTGPTLLQGRGGLCMTLGLCQA